MNVGDMFGRLTVLELLPGQRVRVQCECGSRLTVRRGNLTSGNTASCGCLRRELGGVNAVKHGNNRRGAPTPEYVAWASAKHRTTNRHYHGYVRYGGRGITMCQAWIEDFAAFLAHIGPKPAPGLTLDRIDNERGYEPGNVRWATPKEQANNRRNNRAAA